MSLHLYSIEEKLAAIEAEIVNMRSIGCPPGSAAQKHCSVLKAIAADLRARRELPRNQPLGELERALLRMKNSKTALGYDEGKMVAVANVVVNKWPFIQQALEAFGEESAE